MQKRHLGMMQRRFFDRIAQGVVCRLGKVRGDEHMRKGHDDSSLTTRACRTPPHDQARCQAPRLFRAVGSRGRGPPVGLGSVRWTAGRITWVTYARSRAEAFLEYMRDTSIHLETMIRDLRTAAGSRPIQQI